MLDPDPIVRVILALYTTLSVKIPSQQFTIAAAFALCDIATTEVKIISLGTGSKCLPATRLCKEGDALHDSHAEIIARRGAMRWFLEEVDRSSCSGQSPWLTRLADGKFALREGVLLYFYVSTVPCGDASTRYLATFQDPDMAALKNSTPFSPLPHGTISRGRDNYSLLGVLRTKPGRADSPLTKSMSCSDKIASWNVLGIQGALGCRFLHPIYINDIILGEVTPEMQPCVREDCNRAFWSRLDNLRHQDLPPGFSLHRPSVSYTSLPFVHSRTAFPKEGAISPCNQSLCWVADSRQSHEVLINGIKRGISPKNQRDPKFRPILSKLSIYGLYCSLLGGIGEDSRSPKEQQTTPTYLSAKRSVVPYQTAKIALQGPQGPFVGWIKTGPQWECFDANGGLQDYDDSRTAGP